MKVNLFNNKNTH